MQQVEAQAIPEAVSVHRRSGLQRRLRQTFRYWMETEVHVYGFSIAANVLLSFFPFLIVIYSLCHEVLGWDGASKAINYVLGDYFPGAMISLIAGRLNHLHRSLQMVSVFMLLFTANGVFEPLEVALNRCWGITKNRSYLKNQLISLGLIFACGSLGLFSTVLTGLQLGMSQGNWFSDILNRAVFKMAAVPMSILMLFLIYWLLPNAKIKPGFVLPPAIFVGLALEALKHVNLLIWPWWRKKMHAEYGPFAYSVSIVFWSFFAAMLILAGAQWAAQVAAEQRRRGLTDTGPIASVNL